MAVKEQYLDFILNGGNIDDLHAPGTREEEKLYKLITGFEYQDKINREAVPHVECVLHSGAKDQNFVATYCDLDEKFDKKRIQDVDIVKVRYRFALTGEGNDIPKSVAIRLFANTVNGVTGNFYLNDQADLVVNPIVGEMYDVEATFPIMSGGKDLKTYRYLLPFLMLNKGVADTDAKTAVASTGINVYNVELKINNEVINLIDTASDFGPLFDSKIEHIGTAKPKKIVKAVLNSKGEAQNFLGAVYDLGVAGVVDGTSKKAKAKVTFKLKDTGNEMPKGVSLRLFGSEDNGSIGVAGTYSHMDGTIARVIDNLTYEKEYTLEGEFPAKSSSGHQLSTCRYLKPYLTLEKNNASGVTDTTFSKTHGIEVSNIIVEVNGIEHDITHTAEDFNGTALSKVEIVEVEDKEMSGVNSIYPHAGDIAVFLGDSCTWGYTPFKASQRLKRPYPTVIKDLCKFSEVYNYGISGDTVATKTDKHSMVARYKCMTSKADVIGVLGGINDYSFDDIQFGTVGTADTTTFCGCYETMVKGLVEKYPDKKIFLMTLLPNGQGKVRKDNKTLDDYNNAIISIGKKYGVPVLDLGARVGFSCNVAWQKDKYMPDLIHPSQLAVDERVAPVIANFINNEL